MAILADVEKRDTEDLKHLLLQMYPGPRLTRLLRRHREVHNDIHNQVRLELLRRGIDVVQSEAEVLERLQRAKTRRKRVAGPLITRKEAWKRSTSELLWFFETWSKHPPIGGEPGTVAPYTLKALENIAEQLAHRNVPLPVPMPSTDAPRKRKRGRGKRGGSQTANTREVRNVAVALGAVVANVSRRRGCEKVATGAVGLLAAMIRKEG